MKNTLKKIHFVAIGGIGMSALAKFLQHQGHEITGSDLSQSHITDQLQNEFNIPVTIGSDPSMITPEHDAIVYSPAVPESDPERSAARSLDISEFSYPEMLGRSISDTFTIAIAGTNGKTTTTSMTIESLEHIGADPSGIVGEILPKFNSNFIPGKSDIFITESCEYKRSFLNIHHNIAVITNITEDHLDYFADLADIQNAFIEFLNNKKGSGILVCNTDLENLQPIIEHAKNIGMKIIPYQKYITDDLDLNIPGEHNRQNAAAALAIVEALGKNTAQAQEYLSQSFTGAKRRMEYVGETTNGANIYDDYAHNPEGLDYLINGLRNKYPDKKIIMLFEPHLYTRTRDFKKEFAYSLENVDTLYLFPTYRAREPEIPHENFLLADYIDDTKTVLHVVRDKELFVEDFSNSNYDDSYIIVSAGAGDIWKQSHALKK